MICKLNVITIEYYMIIIVIVISSVVFIVARPRSLEERTVKFRSWFYKLRLMISIHNYLHRNNEIVIIYLTFIRWNPHRKYYWDTI